MVSFRELSVRIYSRHLELKGCGANKEGGGGFTAGNSCARGGSFVTTDQVDQGRLASLKIPPAWTNVQVSSDPKASLQATGIDTKGRKQYIYSAEYSEKMDAEKFQRLGKFNEKLPELRKRIDSDLSNPSLSAKDKESAIVLSLVDKTGFRIGSDVETGAAKKAFGASTLRAEHVKIEGNQITFSFVGKKGVDINKTIEDKRLADIIKPRLKTGGRLFKTTDNDVRGYLKQRDGEFKVKDFRTWHGTALALREVSSRAKPSNAKDLAKAQLEVSKIVASHLGNTPTVAKASYIDPAVWSRWGKPSSKKAFVFEDHKEDMDEFFATTRFVGVFEDWEKRVEETEESEDEPDYN